MEWFIGVWATLYEILAIKISKGVLTQQKFNKFCLISNPNILKNSKSLHNKLLPFSESARRNFSDAYT